MKTSGGSTRRSYVAWGPTYQVLYPAVTVGRVAPLASVADITASWCHSSGLCNVLGCAARWTHVADGQMPYWSRISCVMGPLIVPTADSAALYSPLSGLSNHFNVSFMLNCTCMLAVPLWGCVMNEL